MSYYCVSEVSINGPMAAVVSADNDLFEFVRPWAEEVPGGFPLTLTGTADNASAVRCVHGNKLDAHGWAIEATRKYPDVEIVVDCASEETDGERIRYCKGEWELEFSIEETLDLGAFTFSADLMVGTAPKPTTKVIAERFFAEYSYQLKDLLEVDFSDEDVFEEVEDNFPQEEIHSMCLLIAMIGHAAADSALDVSVSPGIEPDLLKAVGRLAKLPSAKTKWAAGLGRAEFKAGLAWLKKQKA